MNCDVFVVLDDVQFQKGGFQNRNRIKTSQGWQWMTVPVIHQSKQLISEVRVNQQVPWQRKHWNALLTNYASAPYFDRYGSDLQGFLDQEWGELAQLDLALMKWVMNALGITTPVVLSSSLGLLEEGTHRLVEICQKLGATKYLSGPGGRSYMDLDVFENSAIDVAWQDFLSPTYEQTFSQAGFEPDLSVVDALLCCGSETAQLLK